MSRIRIIKNRLRSTMPDDWLSALPTGAVSGVRARRFTAAVRPLMT